MRAKLLLLLSMMPFFSFSQIINGSFENADLSNWEWTCNAEPFNNAPPSGGNWCIKVTGGNFQGCFPGYAFQKLPNINSSQPYTLAAWAYSQTASPVGIYFGKINSGIITLQSGDTTSLTSWTQLFIQSVFNLSVGDTAVVVLDGGSTTGPGIVFGYFDLISLETINGISGLEQNLTSTISPNPFSNATTIHVNKTLKNATLFIENSTGQLIKKINNLSSKTITVSRESIPNGIYFFRIIENNKLIITEKVVIE